jgi:hypothetical protein
MYTGKGQVVELVLGNGFRLARISCASNLIPSPGQYLLAGITSQSDPQPVLLFSTESTAESFIACAPIPEDWIPGTVVYLRGPLGYGFTLPASSRRVALVAFDDSPARLQQLMRNALKQKAAVVMVCDSGEIDLPDEIEVQPLSALRDAVEWSDYTAFDISRENLPELIQNFDGQYQMPARGNAQALIRTPIPCGGIAECGVCAVTLKSHWKLSCKDGPVFDWSDI